MDKEANGKGLNSLCEKFVHAAEICVLALRIDCLRPEVPFLQKFKGPGVGEKHSGKIQLKKVGVGPSSEADTITGQQGFSRSGA